MPDEFGPYWFKLLEGTDLNLLGIHPGASEGRTVYEVLKSFLSVENRREIERLENRGIAVEMEMHALSWLLPREAFAAHPEWFRMNEKGERVSDYNLCVSNPEALEVISENAAKLAKLYRPRSNRYYFGSTMWRNRSVIVRSANGIPLRTRRCSSITPFCGACGWKTPTRCSASSPITIPTASPKL